MTGAKSLGLWSTSKMATHNLLLLLFKTEFTQKSRGLGVLKPSGEDDVVKRTSLTLANGFQWPTSVAVSASIVESTEVCFLSLYFPLKSTIARLFQGKINLLIVCIYCKQANLITRVRLMFICLRCDSLILEKAVSSLLILLSVSVTMSIMF